MQRRRLLRLPEPVASHPRIAPLKANALRARRLRKPVRFWVREAIRRGGTRRYALRAAPAIHVHFEHGSGDVEIFDQVFLQAAVAPPAPAALRIDALGRPPRILDLGANVGYASAWYATRFPGARITCVEPDPRNLSLLRRSAADSGWRVVAAAATAATGTVRFNADGTGMARARPDADSEVPAIDTFVLAEEERPDLVKIDIEGGEWELLGDPRLASVAGVAIGLEFHAHLAPEPDTRTAAVTALESAGYAVTEIPHVVGAPSGEGSLWAWRSDG